MKSDQLRFSTVEQCYLFFVNYITCCFPCTNIVSFFFSHISVSLSLSLSLTLSLHCLRAVVSCAWLAAIFTPLSVVMFNTLTKAWIITWDVYFREKKDVKEEKWPHYPHPSTVLHSLTIPVSHYACYRLYDSHCTTWI